MKTFNAKVETIKKEWFLIDAKNKILGRLATQVATILKGKHRPEYTPNVDTGDYIIIINAENISVTGNKKEKIYHHHTGFIGGLKSITFSQLIEKNPTRVIKNAVKGMLPKNSLGRKMYKKLKIYPQENHPHSCQKPQILNI
jgi:large subunit ribosomal protein L13